MVRIDTYRAVMLTTTFIVLVLIAWIANIVIFGANTRPIGTYASIDIEPANASLCPGDTVTYSQTVNYRDTPAVVMIVDSLWSVDNGRTVLYESEPRWANYTEPAQIVGSGTWEIPIDLSPGTYERRVSGQAMGRDPQMFTVRFTVVDDCT